MSPEFTPYVVVAWVVVVLATFPSLPPHRAVLAAVLSGTLFLPEVGAAAVELGPIKLSKYNGIGYACLLAVALYDGDRLVGGRVRWFDLPMLVWCLWSVPSVLLNDSPPDGSPPLRDALSQLLNTSVIWGLPYLLGRVYFCTPAAIRDLAVGVVVAAAVYMPFCLWESRMSPNLHAIVYGYSQHNFLMTIRYNGYRPMVFLPNGIQLGLFMSVAAMLAVWLRKPAGLPGSVLLLVPLAVLMRSTGAIVLAAGGAVFLWAGPATGRRWWLLALAAVPPAYVVTRTTGLWDGTELAASASENIEADRGQSLQFRLENEDLLVRKALERPMTGWGGWGRGRVYDQEGRDISVTDGLWVILLGDRGVVGLTAFGLAVLLPVVRVGLRTDPGQWHTPELAPTVGCAAALALWVIDNLPNANASPFWLLMAGGLMGSGGPAQPPGPAWNRPPGP